MKILVTGASGYIGSTLVPQLLQQQHQITIVTRAVSRLPQTWAKAVTIVEGDLCDETICQQAVAGIDAVIHLAGLAHVGASRQHHQQENFFNTQQLARAALAAGVKVFVYLSSSKANYPEHSSYGFFKLASENYLLGLKGSMQVVCLRPGIVYDAGMRNNLRTLLKMLSKPSLPIFINSTNTISMISLQDCCHAIIAAMLQPALQGCRWELTDGVRYTLQDLVIQTRSSKGLALPLLNCPTWLVWLGLATLGLLPSLRRRGLGLNTFRVLYQEDYAADLAFANASGVQPTTTLYQMLPPRDA